MWTWRPRPRPTKIEAIAEAAAELDAAGVEPQHGGADLIEETIEIEVEAGPGDVHDQKQEGRDEEVILARRVVAQAIPSPAVFPFKV